MIVKLAPQTNVQEVANLVGLVHMHAMLGGEYHAFRRSGRRLNHAALRNVPDVLWYEQQQPKQQALRSVDLVPTDSKAVHHTGGHASHPVQQQQQQQQQQTCPPPSNMVAGRAPCLERPTDPLYGQQWNLLSAAGGMQLTPANVAADAGAWGLGSPACGEGGVIVVVDNGVAFAHPDIAVNYNASFSANYNGDGPPSQNSGDSHGTSVAGVAVAAPNHYCGVGVCPSCQFGAVKLIAGPSTDYTESQALNMMPSLAAVYQNSWGPVDDGHTMTGPGVVTRATLTQNAARGRGGKGSVYVWAAGNGARNGDNANYDGYANSRLVIAVGAVDFSGRRASYSEPCACLRVSSPSSGVSGRGLVATAQLPNGLYGCTLAFGGTSGAAPGNDVSCWTCCTW